MLRWLLTRAKWRLPGRWCSAAKFKAMPSEKKPNEPPGPHQQGTPTVWLARMRESMARLTPGFFANRTVREHTEQHSLLVAAAHHLRVADKSAVGRQIVGWQHSLLLAAMALLKP